MKKISFALILFLGIITTVSASQYSGTFDPDNAGYNKAYLVNNGDITTISREITVGKFTVQTAQNGTIANNVLTGWMWGAATGWISFNCANVPGSCADYDYKVYVDNNGYLTGYAWGPQSGYVNFAPTGAGANTVRITSGGDFVGYAWSQVFGYISFNCINDSSCGTLSFKTYTDFRPVNYQTQPPHGGIPLNYLQPIKTLFTGNTKITNVPVKEDTKVETTIPKTVTNENQKDPSKTNTSKNTGGSIVPEDREISSFIPTSQPPEITQPVGKTVDSQPIEKQSVFKNISLWLLLLLGLILIFLRKRVI